MLKFINYFREQGYIMTKSDKFMEVLQTFNTSVTIATWAKRIVELYPAVLVQGTDKKATKMTLRELTGRISLKVSKGDFSDIEVENSTPYRKVKYISSEMQKESLKITANNDMEPVDLENKINKDLEKLSESERYRIEEFMSITDQLNRYFNLNFELHHAYGLNSQKELGKHHADNLQLITTEHMKLKEANEPKFTIEEQKAYIKRIIVVHTMVIKHLDINLTDEVLDMLLDRLAKVY